MKILKKKKKYEKTSLDIPFIKSGKQERLLSMFAKIWLSNKNASSKLKQWIGGNIMED